MSHKSPSIISSEINYNLEYDFKDISVSISYPKSKREKISTDALTIMELLCIPAESKYSYDIEAETVSASPRFTNHGYIVSGYILTIETSVKGKNTLSVVREFINKY